MSHIAKACSSVFFHLHNIRSPKKYLSVDSLQTIEHALNLITTQLDYYNRPKYVQISKLQHVQDATARLIIMSIIIMDIPNNYKFSHICQLSMNFIWLHLLYQVYLVLVI